MTRKLGSTRKFRTALVGAVALVAAAGIGSEGAQLPQGPAPRALASPEAVTTTAIAPLGYGDNYSVYDSAARSVAAVV